jgi:dihydroorotate dehydrogenase (fumarate)
LIELNMSCPNIAGKNTAGYEDYINYLEKIDTTQLKVGLKLPPFFERQQFDVMSDIINRHNLMFITCVNSLPNGLMIDSYTGRSPISREYGGIGGLYIKPFGMANVSQFSRRLPIDIIGCGGINSARDVNEYLLAGASAVQIGTYLVENGVGVFEILNRQLEFRGNLENI